MMLGELGFDLSHSETVNEQHFSVISLLMLLLFAIIMPILLMNLLVGLAIGDLIQIQQNAHLKRLAMQVCFFFLNYHGRCYISIVIQVQLHTNLERKLPSKLIQRWIKDKFVIYINRGFCNRITSIIKRVNKQYTKIDLTERIYFSG